MATKKKQAVKPTKSTKSAGVAKKASPAAKPMTKKNQKAAPVKKKVAAAKKVAKPVAKTVKKAAKPAVKEVAAKKVVAPRKPVAKSTPAKKAAVTKKVEKKNNIKTVNKKNSVPTPPAKKSTSVKKTEPAKKAAPAAKKAAPAKKEVIVKKPAAKAVAKPTPKAVAKPAVKTVTKPAAKIEKAAPAAKKAAPAPASKKVLPKKTLPVNHIPVKAGPPAPRPMATPAARSTEKKPNIVIAHRKMENKLKSSDARTISEYQPETYRSILDEPQQQQGPVYRYSDEDLFEFRDIIINRLESARKELSYLQGLITRKDEAGTEDTENRYMSMEDGSGAMEREQLAQLASRQIQFTGHLEKALIRIENKTYGICRVTGKLIDKARLRAVPHATLSMEAKKMMPAKQSQ